MIFDHHTLTALLQVILIDIVLAGDNAIVVGMAAAGLPAEKRAKAIMLGVAFAAVLRIIFALVTTHLMAVVGLTFAGGLLLAWIAWKLWRETRKGSLGGQELCNSAPKTFAAAAGQIILADISMSLDNVLAVAGAAREHPGVLVIGLALSVALMGLAAGYVARLLDRFHWLAYAGIGLVAYVAISMMIEGWPEVGVVAARMF
ncbi:MAG: TerC family protein [Rhodobiaceae bacterium]|nr:TerC family protein [Rhodobiaceae bacterium]MCC0055658.1 TerC family protein [Rhodobiaceae bacterium]